MQPSTPLNSLSRDAFISIFGDIFEHSPWVAREAYDVGLRASTVGELHGAMVARVYGAGKERQLELLRSYPDLAGKAHLSGTLSSHSKLEHSMSKLDECSLEEYEEFHQNSSTYTRIFGFPFILAVRKRTRQEILVNFRARLKSSYEVEFSQALVQVCEIARMRLDGIVAQSGTRLVVAAPDNESTVVEVQPHSLGPSKL